MRLKSYLVPIFTACAILAVGLYFLLGLIPPNKQPASEISSIEADVLQFFSLKADQYAKENAEPSSAQSTHKAGQI
jgi:hypothetical protein